MKQLFVSATTSIALTAFFAGCAIETTDPSESGSVGVNLIVGSTDVTSVAFGIACESGFSLSGELNVDDEQDPPVWAAVMDLPAEDCSITMTAFDGAGAPLCTGSLDFTVLLNETIKVDVVLMCVVDGDDPLGNIEIDATFEVVEGNNCPRLHFLNAVPDEVPAPGPSLVTVWVSDKDGDTLTTALTTTAGSVDDPTAVLTDTEDPVSVLTTYACGDAAGAQTISVTVSDGDTACDKSKSFDVTCPGTLVCEYVQDFEGLDQADPAALSDDGWEIFGQVFDGSGAFRFGYGPFPAPNAAADPGFTFFSAIVTSEGGPDQGTQQLSVFNDYNCCQPNFGHLNGSDRVDVFVFQEPRPAIDPIAAGDIGRTVTFSFDAKRGNINDPSGNSTALAYITTLDPDADFAQTSLVTIDTTNLPLDWNRYEISLELADPLLQGQILQIGFQSAASNFEPSGVFYDNIEICLSGGSPGIELRPLPEIYATGNAINYSAFRAGGPGVGEIPSDADVLEDLGLLQTAGYDLLRLFGADPVSEKILELAAANYPEMQFQQGLFLEGLAGAAAANCDSVINDSQVQTAIRLANTYPSVVTVSVGNETSFFAPFMPLNCLEGYIVETRSNVTQPVTADDDYTFYANLFGRSPDGVLRLIDFVSIHTYPFTNYRQWDWKQEGVPASPLRAEAMMNAALAKAQDNYQRVFNYQYVDASAGLVTIGESRPIVIGETGWKWRQTNLAQQIEVYAANPVNAKWYNDLMLSWERSPGGPLTIFPFEAFDEAWKGTDDGWGFWDELRQPNYVLCDTPAGSPCNVPVYQGAGFFQ